MNDDRITITGELKLPEGADIESFKLEWEKLQQEHGQLIYAMPAPVDEWQAFIVRVRQIICEALGVEYTVDGYGPPKLLDVFEEAYIEAAKATALAFEPDGHYDKDGKPVITAVSLVRRNP